MPESDEGPTVATVGLQGVAQSVSFEYPTSAAESTAVQTQRACSALACYALGFTDSYCSYVVSRGGIARGLLTLDDVQLCAQQVGVAYE